MTEDEPTIEALDAGELQPWLDDPSRPLADLVTLLPFLRTEADARRFLDGLREGLEDLANGRTVPHDVVLREIEERRRRRHVHAAE